MTETETDVRKAVAKAMGGDAFGDAGEAKPGARAKPMGSARRSERPPRLGRRTSPLDEARGEILDLLEEHGFLFRGGGSAVRFMEEFGALVREHFKEVKDDGKRDDSR